MKNALIIYLYEPVFTWKHFLIKPLKWIIKGSTGSEISHFSYSYDFSGRREFINQTTGDGFHSVHYFDHFKARYSKIFAMEVKVDIDFERLHKFTESHIGDKYNPPKAMYSAIDRIPYLNKAWRYFFKIELNDDKFDFCNKDILLILQDKGHLLHIKDVNSLNPEELKKHLLENDLCHAPVLVWNKSYFVNNVFKKIKTI